MYIEKYFNLTPHQKGLYDALPSLYSEWNAKINVISRKDIGMVELHHILHSLSIAKYISDSKLVFAAGTRVLDVGTGGGFPGIPLAIMFPDIEFVLCDSIAKKIKVVTEITKSLDLHNVTPIWSRAENINQSFDYVVSRAVTELKNFIPFVNRTYEKGIIYLKGGNTEEEINTCCSELKMNKSHFETRLISDWFEEDFFIEKKIVFIKR
jgi:16S rRNA (guanine527-N7)-methyltransferase